MTDKTRYLIVGTGRSGSTLLAAILADAGAAFDMQSAEWNREGGDFEHPLVHKAERLAGWLERRRTRGPFAKTAGRTTGQKIAREAVRTRFRRVARELIERCRYMKGSQLVWLVQPLARLGATPRVIVSYRRFAGYAVSRYRRTNLSVGELAALYTDVYETALLQMQVHGGCAVSYEELADPAETDWAARLAALTGLDAEALLAARERRLQPLRPSAESVTSDPRVAAVEARLEAARSGGGGAGSGGEG